MQAAGVVATVLSAMASLFLQHGDRSGLDGAPTLGHQPTAHGHQVPRLLGRLVLGLTGGTLPLLLAVVPVLRLHGLDGLLDLGAQTHLGLLGRDVRLRLLRLQ